MHFQHSLFSLFTLILLFGVSLSLAGCNSRAKIKMKPNTVTPQAVQAEDNDDGTVTVRAEILGGNANEVFIRSGGGKAGIPRSDIQEITHPGNVLRWVGLGVMIPGLATAGLFGLIYANCSPADDDEPLGELCEDLTLPMLIVSGAQAAVGLTLMVMGFRSYAASESRADEGLSFAPYVVPGPDGEMVYGVGLGTRF